ncbi:MAG: hypothetical protein WAN72_07030 [Candidatus Acidiferrales bacterium]
MQLVHFSCEIASGAEFAFGGNVLLEQRNDFGGDGATAPAGTAAESFIEFLGHVFDV